MTELDLIAQLAEINPAAWLLEPRDVYDPCVVGITDDPDDQWPRKVKTWVAFYDADLCVNAIRLWLHEDAPDTEEAWVGAQDWFSYNTSGAWVGDGTPTFRFDNYGEE